MCMKQEGIYSSVSWTWKTVFYVSPTEIKYYFNVFAFTYKNEKWTEIPGGTEEMQLFKDVLDLNKSIPTTINELGTLLS